MGESREPAKGGAEACTSLFVGGCYRSGTTLLEKLLHQHEAICVASQPFPDLYFYCKGAFDQALGLERRYPLDHLFLEDGYQAAEFHEFLDRHEFDEAEVAAILALLGANELGLWTPQILDRADRLRPGTFWSLYRQLNALAAEIHGGESSRYVGGKEVLCEEYVPYLLQRGAKVVLVVRDPRDMVASLNFRQRDNKTGAHRPVLYSLRIWRKSVAICLAHEGHPDFHWLRYEDLASRPLEELARIADFLGLPPFDPGLLTGEMRNQDGTPWKGNSSFTDQQGVATGSIGRFKEMLPAAALGLVESCCRPEMTCLGYEPQGAFDAAAIERYRDPFPEIHAKFPADYSHAPARVAAEIERYERLQGSIPVDSAAERIRWFLFERTFERLAAAV